jgi:uncharacterized protein YecE (DUF72 family)
VTESRAVLIGCSGWNYADWRERFYPKGLPASRWLEHYSREFETVEVNATFYRLARREAVARWVEQTPPEFRFAVKASRYITHIKRLTELARTLARFFEPLDPLVEAGKLDVVLWQLPENFHRDDGRLADLLEAVPPGRHAVEFRHPSWFASDVMALLREHGAALVIGDDPKRPFQTHEFTSDWTYVRFHHGRRGRNGNYSESELEAWARRIAQWRRDHDVYAYFNNDWSAYAIANARSLRRRIAGAQ